jgi:AcrR family transcriptional regulator
MGEPGLSGRRRQALSNDAVILEAARAVFVENPDAPIAAVADRAGVGISALYRRYAGKEDLLRTLCANGLELYIAIARAAVEDDGDPWDVFADFMRRITEADTHTLTIRLAGRFTPTEELGRRAAVADRLNRRIVARARRAGVLRADINQHDLSHIFEQVAQVHGSDARRTAKLRARYLTLHLDALRAPGRTPLPGPPPTGPEQRARW